MPLGSGLAAFAAEVARLQLSAVQLFTRSPRKGAAPLFGEGELLAFRQVMDHQGVNPLVVHLPYFGNLAHPDPVGWQRAQDLVVEEHQRAVALGAAYLVLHLGHWPKGASPAEGWSRVTENLAQVLNRIEGPCRLLIENTAGQGRELGHRLPELGQLLKSLAAPDQLGLCLDTCHLWAAGYPVNWAVGVNHVIEQVEAAVGLEQVYLIHANDSPDPQGSRRDRHVAPGLGALGAAGFRALAASPLGDLPWIIEGREPEQDLARLKQIIAGE